MHSPFVYDFMTQCLYQKKIISDYKTLATYRKKLLRNTQTITTTDFGKGSRVFSSNTRKISAIAKLAGISTKRQQLLYRISSYFTPETSLELGTSLGLGTIALCLGNPNGTVYTVEGCPETAKTAEQELNAFNIKNYSLFNDTFETYFKEQVPAALDLVYIDGNHQKERTLYYFSILSAKAHNDTVFIFDDIYWSPSMTEAWEEIIKNPLVTVSIDTYYWGIVFFRKEQKKQHFTIRM